MRTYNDEYQIHTLHSTNVQNIQTYKRVMETDGCVRRITWNAHVCRFTISIESMCVTREHWLLSSFGMPHAQQHCYILHACCMHDARSYLAAQNVEPFIIYYNITIKIHISFFVAATAAVSILSLLLLQLLLPLLSAIKSIIKHMKHCRFVF